MNTKELAKRRAAERRVAATDKGLQKDPETGRFLQGNIGGGRPKGSRNKLSEVLTHALAEDFEKHGAEVIEKVRLEKPAEYLKVAASLLPRQMQSETMKVEVRAEDLSDDELATIAAQGLPKVKQEQPKAGNGDFGPVDGSKH